MQTNNQNSNSPINPKLGSSVTNAIKNAEAGELPALDDISNITNRVVEKIKASENILIALSKNPNIDEISAALGLAMILDTMRKHVTAIFSGQVPNVLQFLKPEETFEKTTNSLQDFIIALSKDKVDHISYKIEGDFVKVYVTPYKATIGQSDLSMSHGDYNVDLVICFNVISGDEIDPALSEYGRIMHDATAINLTVDTPGRFAELEWQDSNVSSISEMIVGLADRLGLASFSEQVATALLTGIVASTDHFSNPRTSSNTMSIASKLMSFGANQQLISSQIMEKIKTPDIPATSIAPTTSIAPVAPANPVAPVAPTAPAPVMSTPLSKNTLDYIEIEPNPNQTLDGQPLEPRLAQVPQSPEPQISPVPQSPEPQISPAPQPQEPQSVSQPASASQSFESQPVPAPQVIESQSAPAYQAPINPAAAAASAVMENNFIQNPEPNLPQPNYTNETPNYQAPVMPTPPLNFAQNLATPQPAPAPLTAQNLATPQPVSAPFATPNALDMSAAPTVPSPLNVPTSLTPQASFVAPVSQRQPMQYSTPAQSAQPAQSIQQAQPIQPAQPVQPVQSMQYPEPSAPIQPMQFTAPVTQPQPMPYIEPMQPNSVAAPLQSTQSIPLVPPAPVIFDAASMPNQPLTSNQAFINPAPTDLMPPMPPMPPETPATPDVVPVSSVPVEPPLRIFASESPLISQPIDTSVPAPAPIAEPTAIFSPEEPAEPAPAKIDPTAFHIPGM